MKIKVRALADLRFALGGFEKEVEIPGSEATVGQILEHLYNQYPKLREQLEHGSGRSDVAILVDGVNIVHLQGLDTKVRDGAVLTLIPPAGGG